MLGVREELTENLMKRIVEHKQRFIRMFKGRYLEVLPSLIIYNDTDQTSIDFLKLETALRRNINVVVGEATNGKIMILGYTVNHLSSEDPKHFLSLLPLKKEDIHFIIPDELIPDDLEEITHYDDYSTGNFTVFKNKTLTYVSDLEIITHYTDELAELVVSRYSIAMQSKINTFFMSEANDESINQMVAHLYNGSPFVKVTTLFDPKDNIHTIDNQHLASTFAELKKEYQNKISELNNMLGINSLAVEKESGVSDVEAKSNRGFTTSNSNIYLSARNRAIEALNRRYNLDISCLYNDDVSSELQGVETSEHSKGGMDGENRNNESPDEQTENL